MGVRVPSAPSGFDGSPSIAALVARRPYSVDGPADAPLVVLLHGTRLTRAQWLPQVRPLRRRWRCVSIDLPGHGVLADVPFSLETAANLVAGIVEAEGSGRPATLVGLSLGGYVAIATADRHRARVAGLVLAGCSAEPVGRVARLIQALAFLLEAGDGRGLGLANRAYVRVRYGRRVGGPIIAGGFWLRGGARAVRDLVGRRFLPALASLDVPVLVLNGALDPVFAPAGRAWADVCRRGQAVTLPLASHVSNLDRPVSFATELVRFLEANRRPAA